jgi:hypothetical protein
MAHARTRILTALILQAFWLATSLAAEPGNPGFKEEISKQEAIYGSRGVRVPDGYVINRSLPTYVETLSADFSPALAKLGPTDRWLDIGAGAGLAVLDYCTPRGDLSYTEVRKQRESKARVVAMSIEDRRTPRWNETAAVLGADQIRYLFNRRLREYSVAELGQFQIITDVIGGFSYSENLSLFMEKVLGFLATNGSFYTLLQDVHSEDGSNKPHYKDAPYLTEIARADGAEVKICSWLKSISCVEVACELRMQWTPPIEVYRVKKVCDNVTVPALAQTGFAAGTPPERRYRLGN